MYIIITYNVREDKSQVFQYNREQGHPVIVKLDARCIMGKAGETKNPKRGNFNLLL